jgi:hypothetical protein
MHHGVEIKEFFIFPNKIPDKMPFENKIQKEINSQNQE